MEETLFLQLRKLSDSASISEEIIENVLQKLWRTRKIGLKTQEKTSIQSLLGLPSSQQLDPILACLRLLIRKCVHENLIGDDLLKLFPPGLSPELQKVLSLLLQKYQMQWKEEASRDQTTRQRPTISHVNYGVSPSFTCLPATNMSSSMWSRQPDPSTRFNHNDSNAAPGVADTSVPSIAPLLLQRVDGMDNLGVLPRLKSMTWTMQNPKSKPADRVSVISLKLHDYTKSPSGEREVKFQLNKDTLEAMLTSMTYINNQLANIGGPSGPLQKRPRV